MINLFLTASAQAGAQGGSGISMLVMMGALFITEAGLYPTLCISIYAAKEKLDSIQVVYTEHLNYVNFIDTLSINCLLQKTKDVKVIPERVSVTFFTDILAEESIGGIPVVGINMPQGKIIRTFPSKVTTLKSDGLVLVFLLRCRNRRC